MTGMQQRTIHDIRYHTRQTEIGMTSNAEILSTTWAMYQFLGHLYKQEIEENLLFHLQEMRFPSVGETGYLEGFEMIARYLCQSQLDPLTELGADYAKLFLGACATNTNSCAHPYESVYTSSKRLIMQEARDQVVEIYTSNGLDVTDNFNMPEDHIALELEFIAHLSEQIDTLFTLHNSPALLSSLRTKQNFLELHLLNWIPNFCMDIQQNAATVFYRGLAKVTESFIRLDLRDTKDFIARLETYPTVASPLCHW